MQFIISYPGLHMGLPFTESEHFHNEYPLSVLHKIGEQFHINVIVLWWARGQLLKSVKVEIT